MNETLKNSIQNNSINFVKKSFLEEKNKLNEILTTTHTLLESIDKVKKS